MRGNQKLSFRFFGPYKILQRIGAAAYKLELPPSSQILPVVHVSQLKRHIPPDTQVSHDVSMLQATSSTASVARVLVNWTQLPPEWTTSKEEQDLRRRLPQAPTWGHAGSGVCLCFLG